MKATMKQFCGLIVIGVVVLTASACNYPRRQLQTWQKEFKEEMKRTQERRKSPEERCAERNGVMNNNLCYTPDPNGAGFSQEDCRLRAGLYIDDTCLFPPIGK